MQLHLLKREPRLTANAIARFARTRLEGRATAAGSRLALPPVNARGRMVPLLVAETQPGGVVRVTPRTELRVRESYLPEPVDYVVVRYNPDGIDALWGPFSCDEAYRLALELRERKTPWARREMSVPDARERARRKAAGLWRWEGIRPGAVCVMRGAPEERLGVRCVCWEFPFPAGLTFVHTLDIVAWTS